MRCTLLLALLVSTSLAAPVARDDGSATEADLVDAFKQTVTIAKAQLSDPLPSTDDVDASLEALQALFQKATDDGSSSDDYVSSDNLVSIVKQIEDLASVQGAACIRLALSEPWYEGRKSELSDEFDTTYSKFQSLSSAVFPKAQTDVYPGPRTSPIQNAFFDWTTAFQICRDAYADNYYNYDPPYYAYDAEGGKTSDKAVVVDFSAGGIEQRADHPPAYDPTADHPPCDGQYADDDTSGCPGAAPPCNSESPYWIPDLDGTGNGYCITPTHRRNAVSRRDTADDLNSAKDALDEITTTAESSSLIESILPKIDAATTALQLAYNNTLKDTTQFSADDVSNLAGQVGNRLVGSVSATCRQLKTLSNDISSSTSAETSMSDALNHLAVAIVRFDAAVVSRSLAEGVDLDSMVASWQAVNVAFHQCTDAYLPPLCTGPPVVGPIYDNQRRQGYACPL